MNASLDFTVGSFGTAYMPKTREIGVQTTLNLLDNLRPKPEMQDASTQFLTEDLHVEERYPLKQRNMAQLYLSGSEVEAIQEEPYMGLSDAQPGFLFRALDSISQSIYWIMRNTAYKVRTCFYQTEKELMFALASADQHIRVSKGYLSSYLNGRQVLYGQSSNWLHSTLINWPKIFYFEGIPSSERFRVFGLLTTVPHVMKDALAEDTKPLQRQLAEVVCKAETVLSDPTYSDLEYLAKLESEMRKVLHKATTVTSQYVVSKLDHVKPMYEKVAIALNKEVEAQFTDGGSLEDRERYHIDALKLICDNCFRFGSDIGSAIHKALRDFIKMSTKSPGRTVEERLERIHFMTTKMHEIIQLIDQKRAEFNQTLNELDELIAS